MDGKGIIERCHELARFTDEPGHITRPYGSASMPAAQAKVREWMEAAGLTVQADAIGNLRGVRGKSPRLMIGSHIDTVPRAGAFDGVLGVMIGIALAEKSPVPVEVVAFAEEETAFIGSKALEIDASVAAYLEFHIEQGPVLDELALPLGVVQAIAGQSRFEVRFDGKANHAGTTPMEFRRDAMAAAAEWITKVEAEALATNGLVATVGKVTTQPGAVNVIAGSVRASLDVRHAYDEARRGSMERIWQAAREISGRRGITVEWFELLEEPATSLHYAPVQRAVEAAGFPVHRMVSGAGHDAMIVARRVPASMLFLRSPGGVSHHPAEKVVTEDVDAALAVGTEFLKVWRPA